MVKLMRENDYSETDEFTLIKEMNHWINHLKKFFVDDKKAQKAIADYFYYDDGAHQEDFKELQSTVKTLRKLWKKLDAITEDAEEKEYKEKNKKESYKKLHEEYGNQNIMTISVDSGLNADGCTVEITNNGNIIFKEKYSYGYNASYNRKYARYAKQDYERSKKYGWKTTYTLKPYIGDIITELCDKYDIDKNDILFRNGKNVFTGGNVTDRKVSDFINDHIKGVREESYKRLKEQDVEIEVKHKGILEVPEGKNVDDLPVSHFVNLAKKKGLSKITKALNNLQVWNKNDDPQLSKWAGDMIDTVSKKMEKEEKKESLRYIKEGLDFEVIHESDDDEGNPTLWGAEVNSHHYGKFMWIELSDVDGYYDLVYNAGGDRYKTIKSFRTFNSAKKFAEDLIRQEKNRVR